MLSGSLPDLCSTWTLPKIITTFAVDPMCGYGYGRCRLQTLTKIQCYLESSRKCFIALLKKVIASSCIVSILLSTRNNEFIFQINDFFRQVHKRVDEKVSQNLAEGCKEKGLGKDSECISDWKKKMKTLDTCSNKKNSFRTEHLASSIRHERFRSTALHTPAGKENEGLSVSVSNKYVLAHLESIYIAHA